MAFGENSGIVGGGIGQGIGAGVELGTRNYQAGLDRQEREKSRQDQLNRDNSQAAQSALAIKVNQFNNLREPEEPGPDATPEVWDEFIKTVQGVQATRVSLAGEIDALQGVTTKDLKNPDGTPIANETFSKMVLGLDRNSSAQVLADSTQRGAAFRDLQGQLTAAKNDLSVILQQGGAVNNPEYAKKRAEVDALDKKVKEAYKSFTGRELQTGNIDYVALERTATTKAQSSVTMKALEQFSEEPIVAGLIAYATQNNISLTFNTDLKQLGVENDNRTLGEFIKDIRKNVNLEETLRADPKKALAIYFSMSDEERKSNPQAQYLTKQLSNPNTMDPTISAALAEMKIPAAQVRQMTASTTGQELQNKGDWLRRAQSGDTTLFSDAEYESYAREQSALGRTPAQISSQWQSLIGVLRGTQTKDAQEITLREQAISKGSLEQNDALTTMISQGKLWLLDSVGGGASILAMYQKNLGTAAGQQAYDKAVSESKYYFELGRDTDAVTLKTAQQNLKNSVQDYEYRQFANPINLRILSGQETYQEGQLKDLQFKLKTQPKEFASRFFGDLAEQVGEKALNSPETIKLAQELGINLNPYRKAAQYHDWVRSDSQRKSSWTEFVQLMQLDPGVALGAKQNIYRLSSTLGLNADLVIRQLAFNRDNGRKMDEAQLKQLTVNTWATQQNVKISEGQLAVSQGNLAVSQGNLALSRQEFSTRTEQWWTNFTQQNRQWNAEFDWRKLTWRNEFDNGNKQWQAEFGIRQKQMTHGMSQDQFGNSMRVLEYLQGERASIRNVNAQDRQTLVAYGQTLRTSIDDARGQQRQAAQLAQEISKDGTVQQALKNGGIYKDSKTGQWVAKDAIRNAAVDQYVTYKNEESYQSSQADSGMEELNGLKSKLLPEQDNDPGVGEMLTDIFGESNAPMPRSQTPVQPGQQINLTPSVQQSLIKAAGPNGNLIQAVMDSMSSGLVDPATGRDISDLEDRCSQALRLLTERAGVNRSKYFGGSAQQTWNLLQKNGQLVNGGKQLTAADSSLLQPGTLLYQNTPAYKDKDGNSVDYDHIAMYIGNGMVYQHNSQYSSKTGQSKGNLNVLTFAEFSKLFPTYGANIPEIAAKGSASTAPSVTPRATPAAPSRPPTGSPVTRAGQPSPAGSTPATFSPTLPTLAQGTYKAGVTKVTLFDRLAVPAGNGTFNLVNDQNAAKGVILNIQAQIVKKFGTEYTKLPLEARRAALQKVMEAQGIKGQFNLLLPVAIPK